MGDRRPQRLLTLTDIRKSMTVRTERCIVSRGHQYRQLVEHYWDPRTKRTRTRFLRTLGPVNPVYPRVLPGTPTTLPLDTPHLGLLATHIMMGSLTAAHVIDTVREMGREIPPGELAAVGIRYELGEKTPSLVLLLWLAPPSVPPHPAPSARPPRSMAGSAPPTPSHSKGKRT